MVQDNQGFVWIGTQDGLTRYDGYDFITFRNEKGNSNSLSHNFIWDMTKDEEGYIWITTLGNGLTRLDPNKQAFQQYLHNDTLGKGLSHWNTFSTLRNDSLLYVGTNESLDCINLNSGVISTFVPGIELGPDSVTSLIRSITRFDDSPEIWLSTTIGLASFDPKTETFEYYPRSPFGSNTDLRSIFTLEAKDDRLLVVTTQRVLSIDFKNASEKVLYNIGDFDLPESARFHGYVEGSYGYNYLYSSYGLFRINQETASVIHHLHDPGDSESLTHNYVIDLMETNDGALWIGTRDGLSTSRYHDSGFMRFGLSGIRGRSLTGKGVNALAQVNDTMLLVGTFSGLETVNLSSGACTLLAPYRYSQTPTESHYILSLRRDKDNTFWAGSRNGGITRLHNPLSEECLWKHDPLDGASIQYILDQDSILWLGSSGRGLLKYSKERGLLKEYPSTGDSLGPSHTFVFTIHIDNHNNFWLGTPTGGLNLFNEGSGLFTHLDQSSRVKGLSGNFILCITQDRNGQLWVGTTTGLSKLITPLTSKLDQNLQNGEVTLEFKHYGRESGFPNEVIYGILDDGDGHLWISTNEGVVVFDPASEKVLNIYTHEDGCQSAEHNQNAYLRCTDGSMAFGGPYGLYAFHPKELQPLQYTPKPSIVGLFINNKKVESFESGIALGYRDNDVAFQFSSLCYINTQRNHYRYRLLGYDDTWYGRTTNRLVTFTNLDPGEYTLEVKASNGSDQWSTPPLRFALTVGKPPWLTWYAYLTYAIALVLLIALFTKWRTQKVRLESQRRLEIETARAEERELFRKRSARDFHDEAGNKITRINLLVELAKTEAAGNDGLKGYLSKIASNAHELSRGMRDFNWVLDPDKDALYDLVERIKSFGESMFEGDNKHFVLKGMTEDLIDVKLPMDLRKDIMLIFKEAINNAVKHAETSLCVFEIEKQADGVNMTICDHGKGMANSEKGDGYGLKNMKARAEKHGLHLIIQNDDKKGTCISLKLPHMRGALWLTKT